MIGRHKQKSPESFNASLLPLSQCLAKSHKTIENTVLPGRRILEHCQIVGEVARAIILRMPESLRSEFFPDGSEIVAAAHDIGKVSPTFQKKIYSALSQKDEAVFLKLRDFNPEIEKQWGGHAGVSQVTAADQNIGHYIPEILGQHHGFSPSLAIYRASDDVFGGESWLVRRTELIEELKQALNTDFPVVKNPLQARVLSGLTTVSDWIGSGSLFQNPDDEWKSKIDSALNLAGFVPPELKPALSFFDIFRFKPKAAQVRLIEAANQQGVYILEAPMGLGKTEAALYAAYRLMEAKKATGLYFALPTQLTSDKIYERVNDFLKKILDDQSPHKKALLLHGNAWLKQSEMGEEGNPGGSWFAQGKRGILAPFAVGTIDQALMAVMNVKHGFVRTFGLTGKVVILDEVHSYDSFTGTILDTLIKALRQLHCTVIILSATLTQERRKVLVGAEPQKDAYPLITAQPTVGDFSEIVPDPIPDVVVEIGHRQEFEAVDEALARAEEGQQILWIENTVKEAQGLYRKLSARARERGIDCGLLHSRFTRSDRASNENKWVTYYGKDNAGIRAQQGRILVGTQVLEQSLDIDADFLVTRIAPTDMLLQRLGRLWRHEKTIRPVSACREAWILSPAIETVFSSPDNFAGTGKVYAPYVLCRSLMVWQEISQVRLPGQIRKLIEATYSPREEESESMKKYLFQMEERREILKRLALLGVAQGGKTLPEEKAQTRYDTIENVEVLLIRSCREDRERKGSSVTLLGGEEIFVPFNGRSLSTENWREISILLMQNTLKVAKHLAPQSVTKARMKWLEDYFYLGKQEDGESLLRVAMVDESGQVRSLDHADANDRYSLVYSTLTGYRTIKK